jgi:hypothetical protein
MNIAEYFESVKDRILADSFVVDYRIIKLVDRSKNGHLRARIIYSNESQLEFSEFVEQNADDEIRIVTYGYHWSYKNDRLICRWDNSPHFPKLQNAPHHIHTPLGPAEEKIMPGAPTNIFAILDEISKTLGNPLTTDN